MNLQNENTNNTNNTNIINNINNINNKKWFLMLCELQSPQIHGPLGSDTHYLVYDRFDSKTGISYQDLDLEEFNFDTDSEYDDDDDELNSRGLMTINKSIEFLKENYTTIHASASVSNYSNHPYIRNYNNIIGRPNYIKPEIGEYIILPTLEAVAILKTFWLRIIQKTWKNVFKKRQNIIKYRSNPYALGYRETNGKWPYSFNHLPGLRGMLYNLKKEIY
jgi:hypothetical protein